MLDCVVLLVRRQQIDFIMSPEERLNRLERVVKMMASSGQRTRSNFGFRIDAVIDAQIRGEYSFNQRYERLSRSQDRTDEEIKELKAAIKDLIESQKDTDQRMRETDRRMKETDQQMKRTDQKMKQTDEKLQKLIDIVGRGQRDSP